MNDKDSTVGPFVDDLVVMRQEIAELKAMREKAALAERTLWAPGETPDEWTALHLWYRRALVDNERLRNGLLEMTQGYFWMVDLNLNYTFVSPSVRDFIGYTPEELLGQNSSATLTPASRELLKKVFLRHIARATSPPQAFYPTATVEIERFHKDGSIRRHKIIGTFLTNSAGKPLAVLGIARDVTDREIDEDPLRKSLEELEEKVCARTLGLFRLNEELKLEMLERMGVEEALRRSEERYRELFQEAPIAITEQDRSEGKRFLDGLRDSGVTDLRDYFRKNPEEAYRCLAMTKVRAANKAAMNFIGARTPEELETRFIKMARLMEFENVLEQVLAMAEGPRNGQMEMVTQNIDSGSRHALLSWHVVKGHEKALDRIWVSGLDTTAVRQAQAAQRESEERFRTVFQAAQDFMFLKDKELHYTHVNPAMLSLLGMGPEQIIGKTDEDLFEAEWSRRTRDLEERVLEGQEIETEQNLLCIAAPLTYTFARFPMRDGFGRIVGLCGIGRDVTQRRGLESRVRIQANPPASSIMRSTLELVECATDTDSIVILTGESGTGKDFLARFIHEHSRRAGGPFYVLNCAAVPHELAESELFGHEAGAFTGATRQKRGLIELAEGGTLLLNEIGELSPRLQAKLLAFLDTLSFTRVGGEKPVVVNARLMAATNKDLSTEVAEGRFRKDLFYRLNVFSVHVPPLRERIEDIPLLVGQLMKRLAVDMHLTTVPEVAPEAIVRLCGYSWPGNIRELRNVLERALIMSQGGPVGENHLVLGRPENAPPLKGRLSQDGRPFEILAEIERSFIEDALQRSGGKKEEAARILGITRFALARHMKKLKM